MELMNRRTIWVSREWFEQLENYLDASERVADHDKPFWSLRFKTDNDKIVVFAIEPDDRGDDK
jgi:hypothetical protein